MGNMTITLTFRDLKKLALDNALVKGDLTLKLGPALLSELKIHPRDPKGSVTFSLDDSHPEAREAADEQM
jgi:hypothetical protein